MAQIDFSNAVLTVPIDVTNRLYAAYCCLWNNSGSTNQISLIADTTEGTNTFISSGQITLLSNTPTKFSYVVSGIMNNADEGVNYTMFWFGSNNSRLYKVSNISFVKGDTYSFQIDLDITIS